MLFFLFVADILRLFAWKKEGALEIAAVKALPGQILESLRKSSVFLLQDWYNLR